MNVMMNIIILCKRCARIRKWVIRWYGILFFAKDTTTLEPLIVDSMRKFINAKSPCSMIYIHALLYNTNILYILNLYMLCIVMFVRVYIYIGSHRRSYSTEDTYKTYIYLKDLSSFIFMN